MTNRSFFSLSAMVMGSLPPLASAFPDGALAGYNNSPDSVERDCLLQPPDDCRACHINTGTAGSVEIVGAPSFYEPNQTYDLLVRIGDPNQKGAGFEISVENSMGDHIGTLIVSDSVNTQFALDCETFEPNEGWITHTFDGKENSIEDWSGLGNQAEYSVRWQAPSVSAGAIVFYAAGNAINDADGSDGDYIYLGEFASEPQPDCDDGVACTVDSFDGAICVHTPDDALCDNSDFCDGAESCDSRAGCVDSADPCPPEEFCNEVTDACDDCLDAGDCDDGVDCTDDACNSGVCENTANNALCADDGLFCSGVESCDAVDGCVSSGSPCAAGEACFEATASCGACAVDADCDDLIFCTVDTCASGVCSHTEDDSLCTDDGDFCNGGEVCSADEGGCVSTGDPCAATGQTCDETGDACVGCVAGATCDDGDPCTTNDTCLAGVCGGTAVTGCCIVALECDDNDVCTVDACVDNGCTHTPVANCGALLDSDGDGLSDAFDVCPNTAAGSEVGLHGCACDQLDDDADGVSNCNDLCAFTSGIVGVDGDGCTCRQRDDDNDGVDNCTDACSATVAGESVNGAGCAESQKDDDLDGVVNTADECPRTLLAEVAEVDEFGCSPAQLDDTPGEPLPDDPGSAGSGSGSTACGGIGLFMLGLMGVGVSLVGFTCGGWAADRR